MLHNGEEVLVAITLVARSVRLKLTLIMDLVELVVPTFIVEIPTIGAILTQAFQLP